ncbi:hypothetical protein KJ865_01555 [Myxococcota bacterium]|nr:hypothetical protein [Myxococcota bacterium]
MDFTYRAHIQLDGTRPRRFGLFVIIAWAVSLGVAVFASQLLSYLAWIPSQKWLAFPGPLCTPFSWGTASHINILGMVLSVLPLWLFGGRLHDKLGTPRLYGFLVMGLTPALAVYMLLSVWFNTGVVMLGPSIAVMVLLAMAKISNDLPILYKNYLVGNTRYLTYVVYGYTGVGLLINLGDGPNTSLFLSMAASLLGVLFFFDRRLLQNFFRPRFSSKSKPRLWAIRGGKWGPK